MTQTNMSLAANSWPQFTPNNQEHRSVSITKISVALVKAQKKMGNATKDSKNPFFKSSYADLNSIREAVMPALLDEGVSILQPTVNYGGKNYVRTTLLHESGEYLSSDTEVIVAPNKLGDAQAAGSGISYARRYGIQSFLNVGSVDDDGEKAMARPAYKAPEPETSKTPTEAPKKAASFRAKRPEPPKESGASSSGVSPGQDMVNLADGAAGWD